ncbi:adult-specific rigid cuticular protein 15.7-like [Oppia nitens]|uniref:adult-specific rigid cuticular protein 15.7-like n=1 Tax=Oppia nitens TaxID=1686743 RepID=UPI0023DC020D|nr:adult-specific rigid cuticular protein 15.7-like [Oppia nitens]
MKFFIPLVCCIALSQALPGGQSVSSRSQDDLGNYAFGYDIADEYGAQNGREEKGDAHGNKVGSYTIRDADGRSRRVDYVADAHGFRATIGTNEPGTATSNVGDATYLSSAPVITAEPAKPPCWPTQLHSSILTRPQ